MTTITGAESLLRTLVRGGVDVCFTNPGTSEMHFVAALDRVPEMRAVLGLFEGVCTAAADGYARMTGKPAASLLHLGPGLGKTLNEESPQQSFYGRPPVIGAILGQVFQKYLICQRYGRWGADKRLN